MANYDQPIIIKRVKKAHHAHHGGAWKIAYADFVTAMMAFFLLLWLISMTTPEQKEGLADYFAPPNVSRTDSGAGGVLGGTAMASDGAKMAGSSADLTTAAVIVPDTPGRGPHSESANGRDGSAENQAATASQTDLQSNHDQVFHSAAASIRQAWQAMPELAEILDNLLVEVTEDGLDIQFIDQTGRAMFPEGSKYPIEPVRQAIAAVAPILQQLPNRIRISGHTAAGGNYVDPRYGPWELSSDRANIVRTLLSEFGLEDSHIASVVGEASADPYFPNDPYLAANERIKITVLREAPPFPPDMTP